MSDKKDLLIDLVVKRNVSALVTLSEKLEIDQEEVIELINELVADELLHGSITEDGKRFFRSDAKVSQAPVIERDDKEPEFLSFNSRPGIIVSIIGAVILALGAIVNSAAIDLIEQNFAAGLFLIGLFVLFSGLYFIAKRNPPD
jgi:hypothetical protein